MDGEDPPPPPRGPPPLLSGPQLIQLVRQGWIHFELPDDFSKTAVDLFACSAKFFDRDLSDKRQQFPWRTEAERGYCSIPDEKEYITFRSRFNTAPQLPQTADSLIRNLEDLAAESWQQAGLLMYRILCDLARWSNLDSSIWNEILDGTLSMPDSDDQATTTFMRLFRYLPTVGFAETHSDLGILTICIGDRCGLECLDRDKSTRAGNVWTSPADSPRTALILIGSTLKALAGGRFNTGVHRVVGNPEGRNSIVFALRHSNRHDVDFRPFGGADCVKPRDLFNFLRIGKVNINGDKQTREAQRAKVAAEKVAERANSQMLAETASHG
jgi:isopenicillin N synthase-like dioxygenase